MPKVLLPVDGSENSLSAVRKFIYDYRSDPALQAVLLSVQPRMHRRIAQFVARDGLQQLQRDRAKEATKTAVDLLQRSNIPHEVAVGIGERAAVIAEAARRHHCSRILLATARKRSLTRLFENSFTAKLRATATVPVELVAGSQASRWERIGLPAGIGAAVAALVLATD